MASCPKAKWKSFVADLRLDEKREFDEGDLGLSGCIQSHEPSGLHRQNEEPIKRYGGTTAPEAPWPEERLRRSAMLEDLAWRVAARKLRATWRQSILVGFQDTPDARLAHIEYLLEKALRRRVKFLAPVRRC
eukprot:g25898.t1